MMNDRESTWIAVLDGRQGRLLRGSPRAGGKRGLKLEPVETTTNPLLELDRGAAAEGEHLELPRVGDRRSELFARYAVDLVKWLDTYVRKHAIETLEVFASPRLLLLIRGMYPGPLGGRIHEHACRLGRLSVHELERRPEVAGLVGGDPGGSLRAS